LLDRLLDALLEADASDRDRFMDRLAERCKRLHGRLRPLVEASLDPGEFLDTLIQRAGRAALAQAEPEPLTLPAGTRLGAWRLLEPIGSGGMGTVYRAERADGAFDMIAAVKLMRIGRDARFKERLAIERQLLARLDHPNIARIIDGGETDDGQAFLVMEWVEGADLDVWIGGAPDIRSRLDVFEQVARAVGHAHQRRVVHGDLKPANVRIAADGRARLLDFGVARLLAEERSGDGDGFRALTPAFAAPEQLAGEPASTPSDVYALGMLLHWLLTGDVVADGGDIGAALAGRARRPDDLAAILRRACAADPDRRYPSASELLRDIQRYRRLEPVAARRATRAYVFDRFVRRNPMAVGLSGLALLLLIGGLVGTGWQAHRAGLERDRAEAERDRARLEAAKTRRVSDFLVSLFEQADPYSNPGQAPTAQDLVESGADRIRALDADPRVQAEMYATLARVNRSLARHARAHEMARQALELLESSAAADAAERAAAWTLVGQTLASLGRYREAEAAHREALSRTDPADGPARAAAYDNLGLALYSLGRFDAAEREFRAALRIRERVGPGSAETASSLNNLALVMAATERRDEAVSLYRRALAIRRETLGPAHPTTTYSMTNLATMLTTMGRWERAEAAFEEALAMRREAFEAGHPAIASVIYQLGWLNARRGRWTDAERFYRRALGLREAALGDEHPSVAVALNALGVAVRENGDAESALPLLERALAIYRRAYGPAHHDIALALANTAAALAALGRFEAAEARYAEALAMSREVLGETHFQVVDIRMGQAELSLMRGDLDGARRHAVAAGETAAMLAPDPEQPQRRAVAELLRRIEARR
jgi:serine/threonine-protein kinase